MGTTADASGALRPRPRPPGLANCRWRGCPASAPGPRAEAWARAEAGAGAARRGRARRAPLPPSAAWRPGQGRCDAAGTASSLRPRGAWGRGGAGWPSSAGRAAPRSGARAGGAWRGGLRGAQTVGQTMMCKFRSWGGGRARRGCPRRRRRWWLASVCQRCSHSFGSVRCSRRY